ncbi:MAG: DUF2878 domain-containing protein [Planctomycetota bacterium]|jgi:hypothetical protein
MKFLVHAGAFQAVWCACVLGAAQGSSLPGSIAALLFVAGTVVASRQRQAELRLVVGVGVLGLILDSLVASSGVIAFASPAPIWPEHLAPPWIVALWASFATLAPRSLARLQGKPLLAAALGALAGPLTYVSAAKLGAAEIQVPDWQAAVVVAAEYALAMPIVLACARPATTPLADPATRVADE